MHLMNQMSCGIIPEIQLKPFILDTVFIIMGSTVMIYYYFFFH